MTSVPPTNRAAHHWDALRRRVMIEVNMSTTFRPILGAVSCLLVPIAFQACGGDDDSNSNNGSITSTTTGSGGTTTTNAANTTASASSSGGGGGAAGGAGMGAGGEGPLDAGGRVIEMTESRFFP